MRSYKNFLLTPYLKGISQIMLQSNQLTGLSFLAGIFLASLTMGVASVVAVITGTLTARLLKYNEEEITEGLYGFSAALVGIGFVVLFKPVPVIWVAIIIGSALATIIQHEFIVRKIPGYTFPFIVVTWAALFLFQYVFPFYTPESLYTPVPVSSAFYMSFKGFSQVMFIENCITGFIFFIVVGIGSPIAALYGLLASVIGGSLAGVFNISSHEIASGLFGFNAVLCAIALSGQRKGDGVYIFISIVFSVLLQIGMQQWNLPVLTFPFVLATWITLGIKKRFELAMPKY